MRTRVLERRKHLRSHRPRRRGRNVAAWPEVRCTDAAAVTTPTQPDAGACTVTSGFAVTHPSRCSLRTVSRIWVLDDPRLRQTTPRNPRQQRLTVFLIKEGLEQDAVVRAEDTLESHLVVGLGAQEDNLFVKPSVGSVPRWVGLLSPHVAGDLDGLYNSSTSAVLLVETADRLLVVTFGHGRHLIEPEAVVHDFGLKVVLNTVAYNQIKSVDARTVDELTLHTRRDVSRDSSFGAFGLDVATDLVRAVTGTTTREGLEGRLTGSDALALNSRVQVPGLPLLGERLLRAYNEDSYKRHFDFIDHLRAVKDPAVISDLDDALVEALRAREIDNLHLAVPEPLNWLDVAGFRFSSERQSTDRELDSDPRISVYLETRPLEELSLNHLRGDQVEAMRADDDTRKLQGWSVYRCIVFEIERSGELYTLSAGQWYRVSLSFKDEVYAFANSLQPLDLELPDADDGSSEGDHGNSRLMSSRAELVAAPQRRGHRCRA